MKLTRFFSAFLCIGCTTSKNQVDTSNVSSDSAAPYAVMLSPGVNEFIIEQEVEAEMVERRYLVHTADSFDDSLALPLLFAFHGNGGVGDSFANQLNPSIQDGTFIGVYPDGVENSWNLGLEESTADDVAFVEAILSTLSEVSGVDSTKPVAMGFSNGAGMVHKLAMDSENFVGISPQASQLLVNSTPQADDPKVSVLQFHGTEDNTVPYDGGEAVMGHNFLPAEEGAAVWAAHNDCNSTATETASGEHQRMEWENCASGTRVVHYKLNGVGHSTPPNIEGGTMQYVVDFLRDARN